LAIVFVLSPISVHEAQALSPHIRDGWMVGVAYGYGKGNLALFPEAEGGRLETDWQRGVVPQMRVGYTLIDNRLTVSIENKQWLYEQGVLDVDKGRVNIQNWTLALTYYPGNPYRAAGGIYLQAGAGLANARLTLLEPIEDHPYGDQFEEIFKQDEGGTAVFFSAGYEFRIVPRVAAGVAVSVVYQSIEGEIFDDAVSVPATLTLNWYW
jgi:hypothetical protein